MQIRRDWMGVLFLVAGLAGIHGPAQAANCSVSTGQVLVNEVLPAPTAGNEWLELYNTTGGALDIGGCYIDDIAGGGGAPTAIAAGTMIAAHGFHVIEKSGYFNNGGDDARLLKNDQSTVLDSYSYGSTGYDQSWYRQTDGGAWAAQATSTPTPGASNGGGSACGTGSWTTGNLEIHHINIGQGDATLIVGPTGKSILMDAGESYWNSSADAQTVGPYIEGVLGCKQLDYVLISHFHVDHIGYVGYGGLWNLVNVQGFTVGQMLHRNYNSYLGTTSGTFDNWKTYLASAEGQAALHPVVAVEGTGQVNLGSGVSFRIVAVDGNGNLMPGDFSQDSTPPSENDYSIATLLSFGALDYWIGGDFSGQFEISGFGYGYHDIEQTVADEIGDVDVYRVNHHGSDHSNNAAFIAQLNPEVCVISVGDDNSYGHPRQDVVDRLLSTCELYQTEHGDPAVNTGAAFIEGNIVLKTGDGNAYTVNGRPYFASEPAPADNDSDGYFVQVDPNEANANVIPAMYGGCDLMYQKCQEPPELLSATAGSRKITLNWDTVGYVDSYRAYRSTTLNGTYTLVQSGLADSASSWTNTGLTSGVTYYYKMVSVVEGRESVYSNILSAKAK